MAAIVTGTPQRPRRNGPHCRSVDRVVRRLCSMTLAEMMNEQYGAATTRETKALNAVSEPMLMSVRNMLIAVVRPIE